MSFNRIEGYKKKTRDLSMYEFLRILQIEFVVAQLRKKIYPSKSDKAFYERVMDNKRSKIEDIAKRNALPTIFNDSQVLETINSEIFIPGLPNFHYKDEETKAKFYDKDFCNYFMLKSDVRVLGERVRVGKIHECLEDTIVLLMSDSKVLECYSYQLVSRIL